MKVMKKISRYILLDTALFLAVWFVLKFIVETAMGCVFLVWVKYTVLGISSIGILAGTWQVLKDRSVLKIICLSAESAVIGIVVLGCMLFWNTEKIVTVDGNKMVCEIHSVLFSNWINYYDFKNIFIRDENPRIYESYDDSLGEFLYTWYYDEEGKFIREDKVQHR